jgi:quinohemoprotein ethanol dehydrogenase
MRPLMSAAVALGIAALYSTSAHAQSDDQVKAGEALYADHCAECHGENLRSSGSVPDLRDLRQDQRGYFNQVVNEGKGQMPAWGGQLDEQEIDQLWAYIRAHAR